MPYTREELLNNEYYLALQDADKTEYLEEVRRKFERMELSGSVQDSTMILRNVDGAILSYENPDTGLGVESTEQYLYIPHLMPNYREDNEIDNILDRRISELILPEENIRYVTVRDDAEIERLRRELEEKMRALEELQRRLERALEPEEPEVPEGAIVIISQPTDSRGTVVEFTELSTIYIAVGAQGTDLQYQWYRGTVKLDDHDHVRENYTTRTMGATRPGLVISYAHPDNAGIYRCIVSNDFNSVESDPIEFVLK